VKPGDNLLDHAGALELSMHEFQMNLAAEVITRDKVRGERAVIKRNQSVAHEVRQAVVKSRGRLPEHMPLEPEPIAVVKKRVAAHEKEKAISPPDADPTA
jgi:hypothetical protein